MKSENEKFQSEVDLMEKNFYYDNKQKLYDIEKLEEKYISLEGIIVNDLIS